MQKTWEKLLFLLKAKVFLPAGAENSIGNRNLIFQKSPLNKVKIPDNDNIKELMLEAKHKKWLAEVNTRMKKLGFN